MDRTGEALLARLRNLTVSMGIVDHTAGSDMLHAPHTSDAAWLAAVTDQLARHGVATSPIREMKRDLTDLPQSPTQRKALEQRFTTNLLALLDLLAESPLPDTEWAPARRTLGDDLLGELLGISASSLHRYAARQRDTPDDVAWLLHRVALITADLAGGYNEYGIRRWFVRPRQALDGRTPAEVLKGAEDADAAEVHQVADLAAWLVGAGSAT